MRSGNNDPNRIREAGRPEPDAHGQASLLLVESLLHGLIEKKVLTVGEVIDIVTSAGEVKEEIASAALESLDTANHSLDLIARIGSSLEYDRPAEARFSPLADDAAADAGGRLNVDQGQTFPGAAE